MRTVSVLTSLLLAATGTGLVAAPASAATAITCGATVTGDVYLSHDLTCANGITVTGDSTIDLRGHRFAGGRVGITMAGTGAITVRHGRLSNWSTAILPNTLDETIDPNDGLGSAVIDRVTFTGNDQGVDGSGNYLGSNRSRETLVKRSRFVDNSQGVTATYGTLTVEHSIFTGNSTGGGASTGALTVRHSVLKNNHTALACDEASCDYTDNLLRNNPIGVTSRIFGVNLLHNTIIGSDTAYTSFSDWGGGTIAGNRFVGNTTAVEIGFASNLTIDGNVFTRNAKAVVSTETAPSDPDDPLPTRASMTGNRFTRNGDAINLLISVRLKQNSAVRNTGWGIYAPAATDLGGNTAHGNGRSPQCTGVVCS